jgi:hypothetical protein
MKKKSVKEASPSKSVPNQLGSIGVKIISADAVVNDNSVAVAARIVKGQPMKSAATLGPDYSVDKRRIARQEHTNHFTNRAPKKKP